MTRGSGETFLGGETGVVGLVGPRWIVGVFGLLAGVPWRWGANAGVVGRLGARGVCGRLDGKLLGVSGRLIGAGVSGRLNGLPKIRTHQLLKSKAYNI